MRAVRAQGHLCLLVLGGQKEEAAQKTCTRDNLKGLAEMLGTKPTTVAVASAYAGKYGFGYYEACLAEFRS